MIKKTYAAGRFGRERNYRVLKLGNMPKATVDIQPSDFRFGWGRNYMVLKLVLLPIHSFWRRKSYMILKPDFFDVPMNFQLGRVIAGFSNKHSAWLRWPYGLEGNRIAGFSNLLRRRKRRPRDWEGNRIAGCSNDAAI